MQETFAADRLWNIAVTHMINNANDYEGFETNADQPQGNFPYRDIMDRISSMGRSGTYAGEFEISAMATALGIRINIVTSNGIRRYGDGHSKLF